MDAVNGIAAAVRKIADAMSAQNAAKQEATAYESLRARVVGVFKAYAANPTDTELLRSAEGLIRELEEFQLKTGSTPQSRAVVNVAVLSARIRRTHYAAYMAGKLSSSDRLGAKFKCWMHNAAAHGALSLYEQVVSILRTSNERDSHPYALLRLFGEGARADAERFVILSKDYDRLSVLSAFNEGRLEILSRHPERIRLGADRLEGIPVPHERAEAPDLSWHLDNESSFDKEKSERGLMYEILEHECPERIPYIQASLRKNREAAEAIMRTRGDIWVQHPSANRVVVVGAAIGLLACAACVVSPDMRDALGELVARSWEYMTAAADPGSDMTDALAQRGDGGVAAAIHDVAIARGDGGIARGDGGIASAAAEALRFAFLA